MKIRPSAPPPGPKQANSLAQARQRAQRRFGHIPGVQIEVCASAGCGQTPVVVLRHREGPADKLHVHFHGDQLYDHEQNYDEKIGPCVERAWQKDNGTIFVFPEARNENQAPRSDWNNISNLATLAQDALAALQVPPEQIQSQVLSGHSAGGSVLAKLIARQQPGQGLPDLDRLELYDAAVSSTHNPVSERERAVIRKWCQQHPDQFLVVPGVMKSSWLDYIDRSRWTEKASDHWSPLWDSLGQQRQPG